MVTRQEQDAQVRFADRYREDRPAVVRQIEQRVIGGDWGANGYTTKEQADELARTLELRPSTLLLDVGAGRGWPGLYLATTTGTSVVLADIPFDGLRIAIGRIRDERLGSRAWCVNTSARALPFRTRCFDAIVHTDVLC
jgi:hypothetical protein